MQAGVREKMSLLCEAKRKEGEIDMCQQQGCLGVIQFLKKGQSISLILLNAREAGDINRN